MKVYPQLLRNVRVSDKKTALDNEKVKAAIEATAEALGNDGRILVRESGTEPLIRVMVEAGTDELCHKYVDSVVDVMEARRACCRIRNFMKNTKTVLILAQAVTGALLLGGCGSENKNI